MTYMLSWNIKKMFHTLNNVLEKGDEALIEWVGTECWNDLVEKSNGNTIEATEWIKEVLKSNIISTCQLLQTITNETQDNPLVQERLKAVGFVPQSNR